MDIKKKIQKLVFPSGFFYIPEKRQYLTTEVNQLFHLTSIISMDCDGYKNEIPTKNDEDYRVISMTRLFHDPEKGGFNNEASVSLRSPMVFYFFFVALQTNLQLAEKIKSLMLRIKAL